MTTLLEAALHDLLTGLDEDHHRVALVLSGAPALPPADARLAALAGELRRLRWMEPEAPAMALLADAAAEHPDSVAGHLAWMASSPADPSLIVLAERKAEKAVPVRLAS